LKGIYDYRTKEGTGCGRKNESGSQPIFFNFSTTNKTVILDLKPQQRL
jgi:hypothetical protein